MNAPDLRVERSRYVGGSDCAAILGLSPWETPLSTYLWKIGEPTEEMLAEKESKAKIFRRGKLLEPVALQMAIEDYGIRVTKRSSEEKPNRYIDSEHEFLRAEIDFEFEVTPEIAEHVSATMPVLADYVRSLVGTVQNGEVKTSHIFAGGKFGDEGTDDVPIAYAAQGMHGLMVTGRQLVLYVSLVGSDDLSLYFLRRDDDTIRGMRPKLVRFWTQNVQQRVEPEPVNLPDILKLFHRRPAISVEASPEAILLLGQLEEAKNAMRVAAEAAEEAKFQLGKFMLGEDAIVRPVGPRGGKYPVEPTAAAKKIAHALTIDGAPALVINLQEQVRIDTDRVRKDYPEVAAECAKQIRFFRFDPPRKKKAA